MQISGGRPFPDRENSKNHLEVNLFIMFQGITRRLIGLEQRKPCVQNHLRKQTGYKVEPEQKQKIAMTRASTRGESVTLANTLSSSG